MVDQLSRIGLLAVSLGWDDTGLSNCFFFFPCYRTAFGWDTCDSSNSDGVTSCSVRSGDTGDGYSAELPAVAFSGRIQNPI